MRIRKTACLEGDLTLMKGDATIEGNLTVLQTSYLANVFAEKITADSISVDDLLVETITGNTAIFMDITTSNLTAHCIRTDKIIGNTATFVDTTTSNLTAVCIETDKINGNTATFADTLTANLANIECLTVPQIKGVEKIGGPGDLLICNNGDLILQPTKDVILSNVALDFDLTKSMLANVRSIEAATGIPLELKTDPGFKITITGGDGIDMAGTDLCNAGKLTVDQTMANTIQTTGDVVVGNTLIVQADATIAGKLTVTGLIDPTGLLLDGQPSAPVVSGAGQGLIWVDTSVMPVKLIFEEGGNTHTVALVDVPTPLSGNLDMNGYEIFNVSWVDGRNVSADGVTLDAHVADTTIHFTEASIDHGNIAGLGDDDHAQYALLDGRYASQTLVGGTNAGNTLVLVPNSGDVATGNVIIQGTIDSTSSSSGSLLVAGGLGVTKNVVGGQAVAGGYGTIGAADAGITLPDDKHVVLITAGTATGAFAVAAPAQTLVGQVLHIYNNSGFATTGIVIANGAGATLVCDGTSWYQL
jgi:hypothetical protein